MAAMFVPLVESPNRTHVTAVVVVVVLVVAAPVPIAEIEPERVIIDGSVLGRRPVVVISKLIATKSITCSV